MIIKVLEPAGPPQSGDQNEKKNDAAVAMAAITSATLMSCIMFVHLGSAGVTRPDRPGLDLSKQPHVVLIL
ncbi:unnamed protein product [Prunus brigantina]